MTNAAMAMIHALMRRCALGSTTMVPPDQATDKELAFLLLIVDGGQIYVTYDVCRFVRL